MKIAVVGLWHLGCVTAACLASLGHDVIGVDSDPHLIASLNSGIPPIYEPELTELISEGISNKKLIFSENLISSLNNRDLIWVTYDVPVDEMGVADSGFVFERIKNVLKCINSGACIIISSQLPVGSIELLKNYAMYTLKLNEIYFCCIPENLRLGNAINIFLYPERIVIGIDKDHGKEILLNLLGPISKNLIWMSIKSAEMTKHAINSFLALSVAFINELALICEEIDIRIDEVELGIKSDLRIGKKAYLAAGSPYAGGTLARDVRYLNEISKENNIELSLVPAIEKSNDKHKLWIKSKLLNYFKSLEGKNILIFGITYKNGTNTLRCSEMVELYDWLVCQKALVSVYDPSFLNAKDGFAFNMIKEPGEILSTIDIILVGNEYSEYREMFSKFQDVLKHNLVIIDPNRVLYNNVIINKYNYFAVGYSNVEN
jgi:UDPglucose 6-dehydrogenase